VRSPDTERAPIAPRKLEKILLSQGKITAGQLEEALLLQREDRREIGQLLISLGYISKVDLAKSLAHKLGLRYAELGDENVDPRAARLVDRRVLRKHGAIPLRMEDGRLVVAMSDPTNLYALEDLRMISGYPITPLIAVDDEIQRVLDRVSAEEVTDLLVETGGELVAEDHAEVELEGDVSVGSAPIVRFVGSILRRAIGDGASDIHVEPRARELSVRMRVDGVLRETTSVPPKLQSGIVARLKILAELNIAEKRLPQDGRFSVRLGAQKVDLRVATLPTVFGEKVVLRLLDTTNLRADLEGLG
jgi:type IV pilus assembly protein PilB